MRDETLALDRATKTADQTPEHGAGVNAPADHTMARHVALSARVSASAAPPVALAASEPG